MVLRNSIKMLIIFCRLLDIGVPQVMDAYLFYPGGFAASFHLMVEEAAGEGEYPVI